MIPTGPTTVPTNISSLRSRKTILSSIRPNSFQSFMKKKNMQQPTIGKLRPQSQCFNNPVQSILWFIKTIKWFKFINREILRLPQCLNWFTKGKSLPSILCWCRTYKKFGKPECTDQLIESVKQNYCMIFSFSFNLMNLTEYKNGRWIQ